MDGAKKLTGLELDNYQYPLADVSHLSEEEKKELFKRGMCIPKQLKSDDEFEQWVSLYALREAQDPYAFSSEGEQVCLDENEKNISWWIQHRIIVPCGIIRNVSALGPRRNYSR